VHYVLQKKKETAHEDDGGKKRSLKLSAA